eukprot:g2598.t1
MDVTYSRGNVTFKRVKARFEEHYKNHYLVVKTESEKALRLSRMTEIDGDRGIVRFRLKKEPRDVTITLERKPKNDSSSRLFLDRLRQRAKWTPGQHFVDEKKGVSASSGNISAPRDTKQLSESVSRTTSSHSRFLPKIGGDGWTSMKSKTDNHVPVHYRRYVPQDGKDALLQKIRQKRSEKKRRRKQSKCEMTTSPKILDGERMDRDVNAEFSKSSRVSAIKLDPSVMEEQHQRARELTAINTSSPQNSTIASRMESTQTRTPKSTPKNKVETVFADLEGVSAERTASPPVERKAHSHKPRTYGKKSRSRENNGRRLKRESWNAVRKRKLFDGTRKSTDTPPALSVARRPKLTPNLQGSVRSSFFASATVARPLQQPIDRPCLGFRNIGNSCYMNAVLQILTRISGFAKDTRDVLLRGGAEQENTATQMFCSLIDLQQRFALERRKRSTETPRLLEKLESEATSRLVRTKNIVARHIKSFQSYRQQDAHEWLVNFIEIADGEMLKLLPESLRGEENASRALIKLPTRYCFHTEIVYTLRCESCGFTRGRVECFRDLSIQVSGNEIGSSVVGLETLFERHFSQERVEVKCEKCSDGAYALLSPRLRRIPPILAVHLKRFETDPFTGVSRKLSTPIRCPDQIDMRPFLFSTDDSTERKATEKFQLHDALGRVLSSTYDLVGTVYHHGSTHGGGHYTADCALTGDGKPSDWNYFDDLRISKRRFGTEKARDESGYIMIYRNSACGQALLARSGDRPHANGNFAAASS